VPLDEQTVEHKQAAKADQAVAILKAIRGLPHATLRQLASEADVKNESTLRYRLAALVKKNLITKRETDDKYQLTSKGKKELSEIENPEPQK
jgi:predicted transcriptional regulator